jgi:YegS/Rv2252/BmrU family lipid kinase
VFRTRQPGEGAAVVGERAAGFDAVFTLGGDGTAMEVVGALAGSGTPVGILPGGTGNLIARTLGTPLSVRHAVGALLRGAIIDVDLGRLGDGRRFAFAAGVGIDATMIERTPARLKRRLGVMAYMLTASRAVVARDQFHVRVTVDGAVHEGEASAVMVANFGAVLNDLITLGPGIRHDDGQLDACIFSAATAGDAVRVMWKLWRGDFAPDPRLVYLPGREISIETFPPRLAQADGELVGTAPLHIVVEPRAARLIKARLD